MNVRNIHRMAVLALLLSPSISMASSTWSSRVKRKIQEKVKKHFDHRTQVGMVIGVINGNESQVWSFGERALGTGQELNGDTFFEMGSITKTYTATLLAAEVLNKKTKMNDTVQSLWPELAGTEAGKITLEELVTHTAGFPRMPDNFVSGSFLNPFQDYDESRLLEYLKRYKRPAEKPSYFYSNIGMGLLGHLLSEKLNGESFSHYIQTRLLTPLGLRDTRVALNPEDNPRVAVGHGDFFELQPFWDLHVLAGAGTLKSTVNDLLKFMKFNIKPTRTVLGKAVQMTHQDRGPTQNPEVRTGMAWMSLKMGKHKVFTHDGSTGGFRSNMIFDPEKNIGAVLLSNTDMEPSCVLAPVFGEECEVPEWAPIDMNLQKGLIGTYQSLEGPLTARIFIENGFLGIEHGGKSKLRLWPRSAAEYEAPKNHSKVIFKPDGFTLILNGKTFSFQKKS